MSLVDITIVNEPDLEVGVRVRAIKSHDDNKTIVGKEGVIRNIAESITGSNYAVEFDERLSCGHNCTGHTKSGHGWWCSKDVLEVIW